MSNDGCVEQTQKDDYFASTTSEWFDCTSLFSWGTSLIPEKNSRIFPSGFLSNSIDPRSQITFREFVTRDATTSITPGFAKVSCILHSNNNPHKLSVDIAVKPHLR